LRQATADQNRAQTLAIPSVANQSHAQTLVTLAAKPVASTATHIAPVLEAAQTAWLLAVLRSSLALAAVQTALLLAAPRSSSATSAR
jgi:hypothetical protein